MRWDWGAELGWLSAWGRGCLTMVVQGLKLGLKQGLKQILGSPGLWEEVFQAHPAPAHPSGGWSWDWSFGGGFWRSIFSFRDLQRLIFSFGGGFGNPSVCVGLSPTPHRGVGRFPRSRVRALVLQPHGKSNLFPKNSQNCWAHPTPAHHLSDEPKSSALELISSFGGGLWRFFFSFRGICRDWSPNVEEVLEICDLAKPSPTQE